MVSEEVEQGHHDNLKTAGGKYCALVSLHQREHVYDGERGGGGMNTRRVSSG